MGKFNFKRVLATIIIVVVLFFIVVFILNKLSMGQNLNTDFNQKTVKMFIKNGVDRIYEYSYEGNIYYYTIDRASIAVDGTPVVYDSNGIEIDCKFGSPMVPIEQKIPVNPICKDGMNGKLIYSRNFPK